VVHGSINHDDYYKSGYRNYRIDLRLHPSDKYHPCLVGCIY